MVFNYLYSKIWSIWNPAKKMKCINLGLDYYLVNFAIEEDVDRVLKGGPWFIEQQFLAIRQWELDFEASKATFSLVAIWVRLSKLPIEYYDPAILLKKGKTNGLLDCVCKLIQSSR